MSSRKARITTTPTNWGILWARMWAKSSWIAVVPPMWMLRVLPASAAGTARRKRWSSSVVWAAWGAVLG